MENCNSDAILRVDSHGQILDTSQSVRTMFALSPDTPVILESLVMSESESVFIGAIQKAVTLRQAQQFELSYHGSRFIQQFEANICPLDSGDATVIIREITIIIGDNKRKISRLFTSKPCSSN